VRFRILDRYLIRRQLVALLAGFGVVLTVSMIVVMVQDINDMMANQATWSQAVSYFLLRSPRLLVEWMPVAVFGAVLLNLVVLVHHHETLAMMAAGIPHVRIAAPLLVVALGVSVAVFAWNETLATGAEAKAADILSDIKRDPGFRQSELQFIRGTENRLYALAFVHRKRLHNFVMLEMREGNFLAPKVVLQARQAFWQHGQWNFQDGVVYHYDDLGNMTHRETFGEKPITYPMEETPEDFARYQQEPRNMTLPEIFHFMHMLREVGEDTSELWTEVFNRFAWPLASVVMTLLAAAAMLHSWEDRLALRLTVALLAVPAYMGLVQFLLRSPVLGPFLSVWLPLLVFGVVGGVMLLRSSSY